MPKAKRTVLTPCVFFVCFFLIINNTTVFNSLCSLRRLVYPGPLSREQIYRQWWCHLQRGGKNNPITLAQMYLGLWGSTVQSQQCEAWCFPTMQVDLQELSKKLCQDRFYFSWEEMKPLLVAVYSEKCYAPLLSSLASPSPGCSNTNHCSRLS